MADVYKNLGIISSYEEKAIGDNIVLKLKFKRPNSQTPDKELSYNVKGQWLDKIDETLLEKIYGLSSGEQVCVHVGKDDKGYPLVMDISEAKDATDGKKAGGKAQYKKGGGYPARDSSGIAVGAAWTNAVELLTATGSLKGVNIEKAIEVAHKASEIILKLKLAQEARLKAYNETKKDAQTEETTKAMTKAEEIKAKAEAKKATAKKKKPESEEEEPDLIDDDLDDVDFGEEDDN